MIVRRFGILMVALAVAIASAIVVAGPVDAGKPHVLKIQSGEIIGSDENVVEVGFDDWGYNYQARMFKGDYCDAYRNASWCQPYKGTKLTMKWNDAWLANTDRDDPFDFALDRHFGFNSYIGSGAWLTNHMSGEYDGANGEVCSWNYFVKIVAAPADAYVNGGVWYTADGAEIGPMIWVSFAIIQQVENDACAGLHGMQYLSPSNAGLGSWGPQN